MISGAAARHPEAAPRLSVRDLSYAYPGREELALDGVSFDLSAGECLCVSGESGCGKTTLLRAVKGLLRGVAVESVRLSPTGAPVGMVFQNAETQILCPTVAEEVAFGPENLCMPLEEITRAVDTALRHAGLGALWNRSVEALSAGQKHRTCIAAVLSMGPTFLLLDEPFAQLDAPSKAQLASLLRTLKEEGHALLVAEHEWELLAGVADRHLVLQRGRVAGDQPARRNPWAQVAGPALLDDTGPSLVEGRELRVGHPGSEPLFTDLDVCVRPGERLHLFGANGCGKSTLLRSLAGVQRPLGGTLRIAGVTNPAPEQLVGKVGFLLQNPERQLFDETVEAEVAFTPRRLGLPASEVEAAVRDSLALCEISHLAARSPHCLSYGEAHRVALAAVLAPRPRLLLLDEPFSGLDLDQRARLLRILTEVAERGAAVVVASHDAEPYGQWAHRVLDLEGRSGRIGGAHG